MFDRQGADDRRTKPRTKLALWRVYRNVSQREMSEATGIAPASYRRLERGQIDNPPLRWLVNCQLALGAPQLTDLIEDEWSTFKQFRDGPTEPPDPDYFFANQVDEEAEGEDE